MKWTKNSWLTVGKLIVKLILVALTARDTYSLVPDVLVVALIDGVLFSLMVSLEFLGTGQLAMSVRPMAAVGAWILYGGVILVGVLAHEAQDVRVLIVFMIARIAGALILVLDTWELIQTHVLVKRVKNTQAVRAGVTDAVRRKQAREKAAHNAYLLALVFLRATVLPIVGVCVSFWHIVRGLWDGTLLADDPAPEPEGVRVNMPARTASVHVGTQATADYNSIGDKYYYVCKYPGCGQDSRLSQRSKGVYATLLSAQRGFAAHSQTHRDEQHMSALDMAVELIEHVD